MYIYIYIYIYAIIYFIRPDNSSVLHTAMQQQAGRLKQNEVRDAFWEANVRP